MCVCGSGFTCAGRMLDRAVSEAGVLLVPVCIQDTVVIHSLPLQQQKMPGVVLVSRWLRCVCKVRRGGVLAHMLAFVWL